MHFAISVAAIRVRCDEGVLNVECALTVLKRMQFCLPENFET